MAQTAPIEQQDDRSYETAAYWEACITDATTYFTKYQESCGNVEKLYADAERRSSETADREFQIFWANLEVLKPSIYSRPPVPVVVPRFQNRNPLPRRASEMLERCLVSSFELDDIDATMKLARDDLAMNNRGVVWCRYETETETANAEVVGDEVEPDDTDTGDGATDGLTDQPDEAAGPQQRIVAQRVVKEHVDRQDFLHEPARKWKEVGWVARRSWLTRSQGLKRFGAKFLAAEVKAREGDPDDKKHRKVPVWEIWSKAHDIVVWHSPGLDELLDLKPPFLKLGGFFPCPRPAYGTLMPRTLKPVPDLVQYKDQLEEINELTARISSLAESLRLKGFYPGGASDVGDAIDAVLKDQDNRATLVPINNMALFGDKSLKDSVIWLPVDMVATVIKELILLRRQMIDDVYQITGISDIMRGTTVASETLGAQQLKSQYGSIRVRDRQNELVRLARDLTRIEAEIMAENFEPETLLAMSQIDDLPTDEQIAAQIAQVTQQVQQAANDPQMRQQAQENPQAAQQMLQAAQQHVQTLEGSVTVEKVMALLRSQRIRPFALDIETDSTIQPDEDAAKQRATEMVTSVGTYISSALPLVQTVPEAAPMVAGFLKYLSNQFRAGREVQGLIDDFSDNITKSAGAPKPPPPEQVKAEAEKQAIELENTRRQQDIEAKAAEGERKAEADARSAEVEVAIKSIDKQIKEIDLQRARLELANAGMEMVDGPDGQPVVTDKADRLHGEVSEMLQAVSGGLQVLQQGQIALAEALMQMTAARSAPKRTVVVRDANGRVAGTEEVQAGV